MNCREMERLIALDAGGDLDLADNARVRAHVEGCGSCRALAEALAGSQGALAALREATPDELAPVPWRRGLMERIEAGHAPRRVSWRWVWAVAAAGLAVVLVIPAVTRHEAPAPKAPPPPSLVAHVGPAVKPEIDAPPAARPKKRRAAPVAVPGAAEPLLVRLETPDPDVVIYWIVDGKGD